MDPGAAWILPLQVYVDESYEERKSSVITVSGYAFRKTRAIEFGREWRAYLRRKQLPYFHMSECAHAQGVFKDRTDCDEVVRKLIELTKKKTAFGFSVTIDQGVYNEVLQGKYRLRSAYAFALWECAVIVRKWMEKHAYRGDVSYFFEQGHKYCADADAFMAWLFESPSIREKYHYRQHAFLPKETPWLHPADFLAWSWRLELNRKGELNRRPTRADLKAMIRDQDRYISFDADNIPELRDALARRAVENEAAKTASQAS